MPETQQPSLSRSTTVLFCIATVALLVGLGALAATLPQAIRKPFFLPIAILGLGGGFAIDRLRLQFAQTLSPVALLALLTIAPVAYAITGTLQLDAAFAAAEEKNDLLSNQFLQQLREQDDRPATGFVRWASWRWFRTSLAKHQTLAAAVYVVESLLAVAAGWLAFRPRSRVAVASAPRPHL